MNDTSTSNEATKGYKTPNRQGEYARLAVYLPKAIEKLSELLDHPNANVRLGAINKVLDKCLPDLKAMELKGENGQPIKLTIIGGGGFIPGSYTVNAASTGGIIQPSSKVQGISLASQSQKNDNSDNGSSETIAS